MENQQSVVPRRASLAPDWEVPKLEKLVPFDTVHEEVQKLHDLRIIPKKTSLSARNISTVDDVDSIGFDVIDLSSLKFSSAGQVHVEGQGILEMTPWARQQLGAEIGVRWDKFFGQMEPEKIQKAVMDHLGARSESTTKKVIARKHAEGSEKASSVGILGAFVSPSYADIPDAMILDRMETTIGRTRLDEMGFYSSTMTDRGTFMSIVFKEGLSLLGDRAKDEIAYYGLRVRNSEVGAYSFVGDGYILKQVCTNGMIAGFTEDRWLYRRHHNIDVDMLDALLETLFERLVDNRDNIVHSNQILIDTKVEKPVEEIKYFMRRNNRPKVEQDAAIHAFFDDTGTDRPEDLNDTPPSTAYHVMQGIARLGMAIRSAPERQHEIEVLAGDYMRHVLSQQSAITA